MAIEEQSDATNRVNTGFEVHSLDSAESSRDERVSIKKILLYVPAGILFGIVLVKSEVISWFRIQEMFRLQSFHMYGILGSAVIVGVVSVWCIKKFGIKTIDAETIKFYLKKFHKGQVFGGLLFGVGWAFTGACPGPIFAQIGIGSTVILITFLSALMGTWIYGLIREKLLH